MKTTTNYNLKKPEGSDFYDVDDFNYNADVIDQALTEKAATNHTHSTVNGHSVEADVPANAKFTDTVYTHPTYTSKATGLYKVAVDSYGHVSSTAAVAKEDIEALGLPGHDFKTVTLTAAGWSNDTQTATVQGVTSSNHVVVAPEPSSMDDYVDAGIKCTAQGTDSLTFTCENTPSAAITVNVMIVG